MKETSSSSFSQRMDKPFGEEELKDQGQRLQKSLQSLLGLKAHVTPSWIESVCHIIRCLPSSKSAASAEIKNSVSEEVEVIGHGTSDIHANLKIQGDIDSLSGHLAQLNTQRRQALNDFLDLKGNIRVFCRIRPFLQNERHGCSLIASDSSKVFLKYADNKYRQYSFDKIFQPESTQEDVFAEVEPVLKSALDGYNVCIFAYGQTGSGKTFTMEGTQDCPGIVLHGLQSLFNQAQESSYKYLFTFSMLEIHMGRLRDLLEPQRTKGRVCKPFRLDIQGDPQGGIEIENLSARKITGYDEAKRLYKFGIRFRSTASTNCNEKSSRSHCLIRITLTSLSNKRRRERNKLWMVDLGGSERLLKTKASGRRLEEAKAINLSLSALGDVIYALQNRKFHVPYRNSKLTQVLQDSLGSDSKTLMLVHASPKEEDLCETVCSLGFAVRARSVHLDEDSDEMRLKKELAMAELLEKLKSYEDECRKVRQQIKILTDKLRELRPDLKGALVQELSSPSETKLQHQEVETASNCTEDSARLPEFMRPTVCSQRKSAVHDHILLTTRKKPPISFKRKSSSVYAESLASPATDAFSQYDHGSDCCMSTTSHLNCNTSIYGSECNQSVSECEGNKVLLPEEEYTSTTNSFFAEGINEIDYSQKIGPEDTCNPTGKSHLPFEIMEQILAGDQGNKRVTTGLYRCEEQNIASIIKKEDMEPLIANKSSWHINMNEHFTKQSHYYDAANGMRLKSMTVEETIADSILDVFNISSCANSNKIVLTQLKLKEHQGELPLILKDIEVDDKPSIMLPKVPVVEIGTPVSGKGKLIPNGDHEGLSQSKHYNEDAETTEFHLKARRSLFMNKDPLIIESNDATEEEHIAAVNISEKLPGIQDLLRKTFQILCVCILLGLGVNSIGLENDFYFGLML